MGIVEHNLIIEPLWKCIEAIDAALQERDEYTRRHSHRLVVLVDMLGAACGLTHNELNLLRVSASLHDIGKIGVPDNVLLKPAKLEEDEWTIMQSHAVKGERIVTKIQVENNSEVAKIVRHHHEQFDGDGYPDRLKGEDIPFLARILSVCDSYDAMTTTRVYAGKKTHEHAMSILYDENGTKSDPYVFKKFERMIGNMAPEILV